MVLDALAETYGGLGGLGIHIQRIDRCVSVVLAWSYEADYALSSPAASADRYRSVSHLIRPDLGWVGVIDVISK